MKRPSWWPKNPYPESFFPMTVDEYVQKISDRQLRTAVSGCVARWQFEVASDLIQERLYQHLWDVLVSALTECIPYDVVPEEIEQIANAVVERVVVDER